MGRIKRWLGFEKRSTFRDPADWLRTAITGSDRTVSGLTVGPDTALTLSAYFAAIRAVSEDVGKLPLLLHDRLPAGGKKRMAAHPLYRLLHDQPNPDMSSQAFRETLTGHSLGWGGGYAEIVRAKSGRPLEIWPLAPQRVRVERKNKQLMYVVSPALGEPEETLAADDVFHLHGFGFDGITGYSIATLARESIGAALAAERSGAALFGNDARPGGILTMPEVMSDEAKKKIAKQWSDAYAGTDRSHKTAVLEEGMSFSAIAVPHKDSQWIEARQFSVGDLARWIRIPPHKIGLLTDATYSNIASQTVEYVVDTLQPWTCRWEHEIRRKLLPARSTMFAEHLFEGLLRGTTKERYESYNLAIQGGYMSRNQARVAENWNPELGLDEFLIPLNTGPVGTDDREAN